MATLTDTLTWPKFASSLNRKLNPALKGHLKSVYGCTAAALFTTASGAYIATVVSFLSGNFLSLIGTIGFFLWLNSVPADEKNYNKRLSLLAATSFCTGLSLGPLINLAILIDPRLIATAFLSTSFIFICFSLATILSDHYKWLYLYGTLSSALSFLLMLSFVNIFLGSNALFQVHLYLGLAVMCGFIVYDTAAIIERFNRGDRDVIEHSLTLVLDFINVFNRILIVLLQKEASKDKKKK